MLWLDENGDFLISNDRKPNITGLVINFDYLCSEETCDIIQSSIKIGTFPDWFFLSIIITY
jgi:hypothetical protein